MTVNLGSHFGRITSESVDPGGVLIDSQLRKSLSNFPGITSESVDPGGVDWQST